METNFVGKNRIFLTEVGSTNSYAMELLKNVNLVEGTMVYTDHQTLGRGQRGMQWQSEPASNLTLSIIFKPDFLAIENCFYLYKIAALACYDALTEFINKGQFDIKIKWPNDILVNRKKICGILIENVLFENQVNWSILGIGLNVNQKQFNKKMNATSLINLLGMEVDKMHLLNSICIHLEKHYLLLKKRKFNEIDELYLSNLFGLNESTRMEFKTNRMSLSVSHISQLGLLVLKDETGNVFEADVKDIKWLLGE